MSAVSTKATVKQQNWVNVLIKSLIKVNAEPLRTLLQQGQSSVSTSALAETADVIFDVPLQNR